ncbi:unnamed protein product, partial [Hapterophycus canaliculatus]
MSFAKEKYTVVKVHACHVSLVDERKKRQSLWVPYEGRRRQRNKTGERLAGGSDLGEARQRRGRQQLECIPGWRRGSPDMHAPSRRPQNVKHPAAGSVKLNNARGVGSLPAWKAVERRDESGGAGGSLSRLQICRDVKS